MIMQNTYLLDVNLFYVLQAFPPISYLRKLHILEVAEEQYFQSFRLQPKESAIKHY